MKILIVGVSGFIGKNIYKEFSLNHEVFGISRTLLKQKNCFQVDLLSLEETKSFFYDKNFDVIIYLSSVMASRENINDKNLLLNNLHMQFNLIECVKSLKYCYLINFSSSAVYPNVNGEFSEKSIIDPSKNPDCLYGLSKMNSEILFDFCLSNINLLNIRMGYVYGEGMNPSRIHKVFENELLKNNTISVWGNGIRTIPQLSINFLINILKKCLNNPINGTFNLCEENISLEQIAKKMIDWKGNSESKILYIDKGSVNKFKMDSSKIMNTLK
jgi:nucleoside-diphosphate-sugar epimerase